MQRGYLLSLVFLVLTSVPPTIDAQAYQRKSPLLAYPRDRILRPIDDQRRVVLPGNRYPLADEKSRIAAAPGNLAMDHMILALRPDAEQQAALDEFVAGQHDSNSPYYHQWLTPERFGELFGASENDIQLVVNWLESHGMKVEEVTPGRRAIVFSGTAAKVSSTFHTRIQTYKVLGETHRANETDPQIPQALASVVDGIVSLHDFRAQPQLVTRSTPLAPTPSFSSGASHYLTPADFATIYNLGPLY